jgi:TPR repeat protein
MLYRGEGAGRDLQEAVKLWTWAANQGDATAQFDLASMYSAGTGVQRGLVKAYSLFTLAGKTLDVRAQLRDLGADDLKTMTIDQPTASSARYFGQA